MLVVYLMKSICLIFQKETTTPVEHPTTQISTPAGVNLLMKRTRTDDGETR